MRCALKVGHPTRDEERSTTHHKVGPVTTADQQARGRNWQRECSKDRHQNLARTEFDCMPKTREVGHPRFLACKIPSSMARTHPSRTGTDCITKTREVGHPKLLLCKIPSDMSRTHPSWHLAHFDNQRVEESVREHKIIRTTTTPQLLTQSCCHRPSPCKIPNLFEPPRLPRRPTHGQLVEVRKPLLPRTTCIAAPACIHGEQNHMPTTDHRLHSSLRHPVLALRNDLVSGALSDAIQVLLGFQFLVQPLECLHLQAL